MSDPGTDPAPPLPTDRPQRRSSRYQLDTSTGLASEEAAAEQRGREAAAADAPRQTRGLKHNISISRLSIGEQDLQNLALSSPDRKPPPEQSKSAPHPLQFSESLANAEPGSIPIRLFKDNRSIYFQPRF